jgi:mRNA-degrading endonuclease RelE of RelBE toxin-antitoxin system
MSYKLIPTPPFERDLKHLAKKYPSLQKDLAVLEDQLLKQPTLGTPIGRNCFKIRIAIQSKGKGKSGGARLITYVQIINQNIYMIAIYDKAEAGNISDKELQNRLKNLF